MTVSKKTGTFIIERELPQIDEFMDEQDKKYLEVLQNDINNIADEIQEFEKLIDNNNGKYDIAKLQAEKDALEEEQAELQKQYAEKNEALSVSKKQFEETKKIIEKDIAKVMKEKEQIKKIMLKNKYEIDSEVDNRQLLFESGYGVHLVMMKEKVTPKFIQQAKKWFISIGAKEY